MGGTGGSAGGNCLEGGEAPPHRSPLGSLRVLWAAVKTTWMMGKWASEGGGDGTKQALQWPTSLLQVDPDVGQLLSMLTAELRMGIPRINTFSGDVTPGKTEVSFEPWYHEVQCVKDHYAEPVV